MLMEVRKRLSETEKAAMLEALAPRAERQARLTRRSQALLAAAGQDAPERRWYVLMVAPNYDIPVDNALANAGVERWMAADEFKPKRRRRGKWQRFCAVVVPALPGYLFVQVIWTDEAAVALRSIEGVDGVIGGWMRPAPLKGEEIDKLRVRVEEDPEFIAVLRNALKQGDPVRVDYGPFSGFEGVVEMLGQGRRVKVEVGIFGRSVPIDLDVDQVTKLD